MTITLTDTQYAAIKSKWNFRNEDEYSWICDICKAKVVGDGDMIAQVGGPFSPDEMRGKLIVMKICTDCHVTLSMAVGARRPK